MMARAGSEPKGHVFVIAAPSGTGKTTICRRLLERDPRLRLSISHTTRESRPGEKEGVDYHFVSAEAFRELVEADGFLEHAEYGGNVYGTSFRAIEEPIDGGLDVLLEIEVQGASQVRERRPAACLIFILPPNLEVLEDRLRGRGTDEESVIQRRMSLVDRELAVANIFDYAVINDDLDEAVSEVHEVIAAIRDRRGAEITLRYGRAGVLERWGQSLKA